VWFTGIRPGPKELFSLKWDSIDFDRNIIRVLGKRNLWREIPISGSFKEKLLVKKQVSQTVHLIEYNGRPIKQLRRSLKTAALRAGITYSVCMYDVRHLFASLLLSKGADLAAVSKILGHTSTKMTADQYYHLLYGEKKRAVELVPEIVRDGLGTTARSFAEAGTPLEQPQFRRQKTPSDQTVIQNKKGLGAISSSL
jgi:integrase